MILQDILVMELMHSREGGWGLLDELEEPRKPWKQGMLLAPGEQRIRSSGSEISSGEVIRGSNWVHLTLQMLLCRTRQEDRSISTIIH